MNRIKEYEKVQVMTADGVQLVVMLCEGVIKFNRLAQQAIEANDIEGRNRAINRVIAIISELGNALDMDKGGEVARNLARLYEYCTYRLSEANLRNDRMLIDSVTMIFSELKEGWQGIAGGKVAGTGAKGEISPGYGI